MITEIIITVGCIYCILDFFLSWIKGRCVLPGLKCRACKEDHPNDHGYF